MDYGRLGILNVVLNLILFVRFITHLCLICHERGCDLHALVIKGHVSGDGMVLLRLVSLL